MLWRKEKFGPPRNPSRRVRSTSLYRLSYNIHSTEAAVRSVMDGGDGGGRGFLLLLLLFYYWWGRTKSLGTAATSPPLCPLLYSPLTSSDLSLLFCSLFNDAVMNSAFSDWMIVNNDLERMWKKTAVAWMRYYPGFYLEVLSKTKKYFSQDFDVHTANRRQQ
jgi:hypothetical protein